MSSIVSTKLKKLLVTILQSLDDLVPISEQVISLLTIGKRRAREGAAAAMKNR